MIRANGLPFLLTLLVLVCSSNAAQQYSVPKGFMPNKGQVLYGNQDSRKVVKYYAELGGVRVFFRDAGYSYVVFKYPDIDRHSRDYIEQLEKNPIQQFRVDVDFVGANQIATIEEQEQNTGFKNYYHTSIGEPVLGVSSYKQITYKNIYNGIDLKFTISETGLKYDFVVGVGADPSKIKMKYSEPITLSTFEDTRTNDLFLHTPVGDIVDQSPISIQEGKSISTSFKHNTDNTISFTFPLGYNTKKELVIDPAIVWSTYLGGTKDEQVIGTTLDNNDNFIVSGYTISMDFPMLGHSRDGVASTIDFLLVKFDKNGIYKWSVVEGGNNSDLFTSVTNDKVNDIYVTGFSKSTDLAFPGAPNPNLRGQNDVVIIKYNGNDGNKISGTFYGDAEEDNAYAIKLDSDGKVLVAGKTDSKDFPSTNGKYTVKMANTDGFLMKCEPTTFKIIWSTFYGGRDGDRLFSLSVDSKDNIYVVGDTRSPDLPGMNSNSMQATFSTLSNASDFAIVSFTKNGQQRWSTYFGAEGEEVAYSVDCRFDRVAVAGFVSSPFLKLYGKYHSEWTAFSDGFVLVLDTLGVPQWSTYIGGTMGDALNFIKIDKDTSVVAGGSTFSRDYPLLRPFIVNTKNSSPTNFDIVLTKFESTGKMLWSTFLGGNGDDQCENGFGDIDESGNVYVAFHTQSNNNIIKNQTYSYKGGLDAYITKLCMQYAEAKIILGDSVICEGNSSILSASAGLSNIKWSPGGENTPAITVTKAGKYFYTADAGTECTGLVSDTITITTRPGIVVKVDSSDKLQLCEGKTVKLFSKTKYKIYNWVDGNGSSVSTKDTLPVSTPGTYHLEVTDSTGCSGKSTSVTVTNFTKPNQAYRFIINGVVSVDSQLVYSNLCLGDIVEVTPLYATTSTALVVWKDNTLNAKYTITKNDSTFAIFTDEHNCQWTLPEVKFYFRQPSKPLVSGVDSTCVNSVVTLTATLANSPGIKYEWLTDGGSIVGSTDTSDVKIQWSTGGLKQIRVLGAKGVRCVDTSIVKTVFVQSGVSGKISAVGNTLLCENESVQLNAPDGFTGYQWNNTTATKSLTVTTPGQYFVQFQTTTGCFGYDTIIIGKRLVYTTSPVQNSFGSVTITNSSQQRLVIYNFSSEVMSLSGGLFDGRHYTIDSTQPPMQNGISPKDSLIVYVSFVPKNINTIRDTIKVTVNAPCADSVLFYLEGIGVGIPPKPQLRFRVHDVSIQPHQDTVHIPIDAWLEPNVATLSLDTLIFTLAYNPTIFHITKATKGNVTNEFYKRPQQSYATVRIPLTVLALAPQTVTEIIADVLIGDVERDSLFVASADVAPSSDKSVNTIGGNVIYSGLCKEGGTRLIGQSQSIAMMLKPNPGGDDVTITVHNSEKGFCTLTIYNTQGEEVWNNSWVALPMLQTEHRLQQQLPSGIYQVVCRTPSQIIQERLVIVR